MFWSEWWVWVVGGAVISIIELFIPGYLFLGFGIGAMLTGFTIWLGMAGGASFPVLLTVFGVLSLVSWLAMRRALGLRKGQVKRIDRDINDNQGP